MRGLMALQHAMSDNLANASTAGYKKNVVSFGSFQDALGRAAGSATAPTASGSGTTAVGLAPTSVLHLDLTQGTLEQTGNPLDLAMEGSGWLVVRSPQGDALARGGSFHVDDQGHLANAQGAVLVGTDGTPIRAGTGHVAVDAGGSVKVDGADVGRLQQVACPADALQRLGGALKMAPGTEAEVGTAQIRQGCLERSNAEPVGEMVHMIETLRSFELLQHVVRAADEMQQRAATDVGRIR
jgi:flagellar basal-body rod protein FlgF